MQYIDEARLETDVAYRFNYLKEFIGFSDEDVKLILGSAGALAPNVKGLVEAVYDKLFSFDSTKRHFVPRQSGYAGEVPVNLESLSANHPMIQFRKDKLARYLVKLVSGPYDGSMVNYLDVVGKIHTDKAGAKDIVVPLVQMNVLMGFVADALNATIFSLNLPRDTECKTIRAFSKLLWIQNDLITRHYQG